MTTSINSSYASILAALQQQTKGAQSSGTDFTAILASVSKTESTAEAEPKSLEQYKEEIAAKISAMPIHPSQAKASQSVSIHDDVFEKMMNDPEYEAELLGEIGDAFAANYGITDPAFCTIRYDANGEFSGTAGGSMYMDKFEQESSDAFWKKKPSSDKAQEKKDEMTKFLDELYERKRTQKQSLLENFMYSSAGQEYGGGMSMKDMLMDFMKA